MNKLILLLSLFGSLNSNALIKVAVIDTGFDFNSKWTTQPKLCTTGHKDFTGTGIQDTHGHGTHIAGLIAKYAKDSDYCLIILKFWDKSSNIGVQSTIDAFKWAVDLKVDYINYSAGGTEFNRQERDAVLNALNANITVVVAAGNEGKSYDKQAYYPALYDSRIVVVGNVDTNGKWHSSSNYGKQVDVVEMGVNVLSLGLNSTYAVLTGTSQATAIHTGKLLYKFKKFDSTALAK